MPGEVIYPEHIYVILTDSLTNYRSIDVTVKYFNVHEINLVALLNNSLSKFRHDIINIFIMINPSKYFSCDINRRFYESKISRTNLGKKFYINFST